MKIKTVKCAQGWEAEFEDDKVRFYRLGIASPAQTVKFDSILKIAEAINFNRKFDELKEQP